MIYAKFYRVILLTHTEAPTQRITSFIAEPESPVIINENFTEDLIWKIMDCEWEVRVVTENYTLHPNTIPRLVPIKKLTDYNVTETCINDRKIVHFSITFNENVLKNNIGYVTCKVFRSDDLDSIITSCVNFATMPLFSMANTETATTSEPNSSSSITTSTGMTTGSSGCNLLAHFKTLTLGLIITMSVLSWISEP